MMNRGDLVRFKDGVDIWEVRFVTPDDHGEFVVLARGDTHTSTDAANLELVERPETQSERSHVLS